jgi:hypothetical protein
MFSRFAQSAKSAMEESFLMITDKLIIEFRASKLTVSSGTGEWTSLVTLARHYRHTEPDTSTLVLFVPLLKSLLQ